MADIFLSYKREDRPVAERLSIALEQLGFNVWWDFQILSGQQFRRVIEQVIDQCAATLVLWSTLSRDSTFVVDEATYARDQNKLCPARIDNCRLPLGFGGDHVVDLTGWDGEMQHPGLQELLHALEAKTGKKARLGAKPRTETDEIRYAEMEAFKAAQAAENISALRAFLRDYPKGAFANFVTGQLETMQADARVAAESRAQEQRSAPPPAPPPAPPVRTPPSAERPQHRPSFETPEAPRKTPPWALIGLAVAVAIIGGGGFLYFQAQQGAQMREEAQREREARVAAEERVSALEAQAQTERVARESAEQTAAQLQQAARDRTAIEEAAQQADDEAWSRARGQNTTSAYNRYLSAYPSGRHAAEARTALARLSPTTTAQTTLTTRPTAFDISQLNPLVQAAVVSARANQRDAQTAAGRARSARQLAEQAGAITPSDGYGLQIPTDQFAGDRYSGQWRNGLKDGLGVYEFALNASNPDTSSASLRYEGNWREDSYTGLGVFTWRSGNRYEGPFLRGHEQGAGVFTYQSGRRYEGEHTGGRENGYGVLWTADGRVEQAGIWNMGTLVTPLSR